VIAKLIWYLVAWAELHVIGSGFCLILGVGLGVGGISHLGGLAVFFSAQKIPVYLIYMKILG